MEKEKEKVAELKRWNRGEEKIPKTGETVIVWTSSTKGFMDMTTTVFWCPFREKWFWVEGDYEQEFKGNIHGWMKWPEPQGKVRPDGTSAFTKDARPERVPTDGEFYLADFDVEGSPGLVRTTMVRWVGGEKGYEDWRGKVVPEKVREWKELTEEAKAFLLERKKEWEREEQDEHREV